MNANIRSPQCSYENPNSLALNEHLDSTSIRHHDANDENNGNIGKGRRADVARCDASVSKVV